MKMKLAFVYLSAALTVLVSCGRRQAAVAATSSQKGIPTTEKSALPVKVQPPSAPLPSVPLPSVPAYLSDDKDRMGYVLLHYWEGTDLSDPRWEAYPEVMEEAFSRFAAMGNIYPDPEVSRRAVARMMNLMEEKATEGNYHMLTALADKYFYDPNSPFRNEELYITVLEGQIANKSLEDIYKIAPRERLRMALKNRAGTKAADFSFTTTDGRHGTLYGTEAEYTVLLFYNPGCPACREVREGMLNVLGDEPLASMVAEGGLKILSIYPDNNVQEWKDYASDIPQTWTNGYDPGQQITDQESYDLKAIPSLYLLDRDKIVLLKDFTDPTLIYKVIVAGGTF